MSSKYIVRQPIKDGEGTIVGHEILYYGENQAFTAEVKTENDYAAADTIYNFLTQNSCKALKGTLNFMTFTTMLLMKKTPRLFDKSDLVIQIDDSVIIHPLSMHFVNMFAKEGYKIAVNEFQFAPRYLATMDSIDYIKVNITTTPADTLRNIVEIAHSMNKKCIVTNIETAEQYELAKSLKVIAYEGPFVAGKLKTKAHSSEYLQSNFFRLMVEVSQDEPDVDQIEQMISMDAGLSYGILKMANSAYFALRHRATTIHQAIMTLGLGQLKQWVYLLSASLTDQKMDEGTEEFLKLSFLRANFSSELLKYASDMPISRAEAYLMGMFSTLDHLIDAPMEEIMGEVPVADEVKRALISKEGRCGILYKLVLSYEAANWAETSQYAQELGIPDQMLASIYFECVDSVNALWEQLTKSSPNQLSGEADALQSES